MQDKTAGKRMKREDPGKESDEAMHFPSFTFQDMTEFLLKLQNVLFPLAPSLSLSFPVSALDFTFLSTLPISIDTKKYESQYIPHVRQLSKYSVPKKDE